MTELSDALSRIFHSLGLVYFTGERFLMLLVGLALVLFAVLRRRPAFLLLILGFGILTRNMPFSPVEAFWDSSAEGYGLFAWLKVLLDPNLLPALVFLALGAATDFGPLIASPRLALLGAAAQVGLLAMMFLGHLLLPLEQSAVAAAAGGAHPLLAVYAASALNPYLLAPAALAACAAARLAPVLIPLVARPLTTSAERALRMAPPRPVPRRLRLLFPVVTFLLGVAIFPAVRIPLAMLFLGNLLREGAAGTGASSVSRFSRAAVAGLAGVLAFAIGLVTGAGNFLSLATLGVFLIALVAFVLAAGWGVLMAKIMNVFPGRKINPLLGAAALTPAPRAARAVQHLAAAEDPANNLLPLALAPNLAGTLALLLLLGLFIGTI